MSKAGCEVTAGCGNSFQRIFAKAEKVGANSCRKKFENRIPFVFREYVVSEVDPVGLREDGIEQPE